MIRPLLFVTPLLATVLLVAAPARADDRTYSVGSFDHVRIDAPVEVRIATGGSPGATVTGDRTVIDRLKVELNGTRLVVRMGIDGWGEVPRSSVRTPTILTLRTPQLASIIVNAGAKVSVDRMIAQRLNLAVSGSGALSVARAEGDQVTAILSGTGTLTIAGKAQRATLALIGSGGLDAARLDTAGLTARLDGTGLLLGNARATARINASGLGRVDIAGAATCTILSSGSGPITCASKP